MLLSSTNQTTSTPAPVQLAQVAGQRAAAPVEPAKQASAPATGKSGDNTGVAPADVEDALKTLNKFTSMVAQDVLFSMDQESGRSVVKVVDTATKEVLRQFPSEEALSIARSIDKMQGLLIREKA